jgi:hypothetical protein
VLETRFLDQTVERAVTGIVGHLARKVDDALGPLSPFRRNRGSEDPDE